jgi:hypothetical protein
MLLNDFDIVGAVETLVALLNTTTTPLEYEFFSGSPDEQNLRKNLKLVNIYLDLPVDFDGGKIQSSGAKSINVPLSIRFLKPSAMSGLKIETLKADREADIIEMREIADRFINILFNADMLETMTYKQTTLYNQYDNFMNGVLLNITPTFEVTTQIC